MLQDSDVLFSISDPTHLSLTSARGYQGCKAREIIADAYRSVRVTFLPLIIGGFTALGFARLERGSN